LLRTEKTKNMNIKKILPILLFLTTFTFYAQDEKMKEKKEQINALKIAFLTTKLNLTNSEAEKFWPIYNAFNNKQFELRHQKMKVNLHRCSNTALDTMSEKEASALLTQMETADEEIFYLRKKLLKSLKEALPPVKIVKLRKSEDDFNRKLLHQYREKTLKK
jgi:Spy/CpxP family protein refolding chaperone